MAKLVLKKKKKKSGRKKIAYKYNYICLKCERPFKTSNKFYRTCPNCRVANTYLLDTGGISANIKIGD